METAYHYVPLPEKLETDCTRNSQLPSAIWTKDRIVGQEYTKYNPQIRLLQSHKSHPAGIISRHSNPFDLGLRMHLTQS